MDATISEGANLFVKDNVNKGILLIVCHSQWKTVHKYKKIIYNFALLLTNCGLGILMYSH